MAPLFPEAFSLRIKLKKLKIEKGGEIHLFLFQNSVFYITLKELCSAGKLYPITCKNYDHEEIRTRFIINRGEYVGGGIECTDIRSDCMPNFCRR